MNCFRAWEDWALYPPKYLIRLQNIFLGLEVGEEADEEVDGKPLVEAAVATPLALSTLVVPATDVDLDGVPSKCNLLPNKTLVGCAGKSRFHGRISVLCLSGAVF